MKSIITFAAAVVVGLFGLSCPGQTITPPVDTIVGIGSNATLSVRVTPVPPGLHYQWTFWGTPIAGATASKYTIAHAAPSHQGYYSVQVTWTGSPQLNYWAYLTVRDLTPPGIKMTLPAAGTTVNVPMVNVRGSASDNIGLSRIEYRVNGGPFNTAQGTTNWTALASLVAGTNVIGVRAVDTAGNYSVTVSRSVFYAVYTPMSVTIVGKGTVSPNFNTRSLAIGRAYTMVATQGTGYVLDGWYAAGGQPPRLSESRSYTFIMQQGLSLVAKFVPNPFIAKQGTYQGLFGYQGLFDSRPINHQSSGAAAVTVASSGAYSASLRLAGKTYPFTGQFNVDGDSRKQIKPAGESPIDVNLHVSTDTISGYFARTNWIEGLSYLFAGRAKWNSTTNPCPYAGRYTWVNNGFTDRSFARWQCDEITNYDLPWCSSGDGFGTMTVDRLGLVTFAGTLPDNQPVVASATLFSYVAPYYRLIPLYVPMYNGKGSMLSWLITNSTYTANWIRPAITNAMRYPGGCTNKSIILTSRYVAPKAGVRALAVTNAGASFSASPGSLASPFVNQLAWGANNRVTNRSSNRLVMTITNSTGLFAGSVVDPASGATLVYKGALLQDRNYGSGLILLPAEQKATGQMHVEDLYCVERKGMVCIDPGWFMMGSPATEKDRVSTEGPQTQVTISHPFWMGNYPVTQAEFEAVKGYNPSTVVGAHLPVQSLNWLEANNYCELLTEQERAANRLPAGYVYRLPTEAEWEYACRAGTSTRFGYGDDLNYTSLGNYAWYTSNSGWALHEVGLKLPNPWGLYDMHGNVYQWCMDGFGTYPGGSVTDPVAPMVNGVMVARGGSYISSAAGCRSAFRVNVYLADYYGILGFRVVLAPALP